MEINGINMDDLKKIEFTYDNLHLLDIIKYFIGVVLNDVEYMNSDIDKDTYDLLLGNNTYIKRDDLESLYSILDTINDIEKYNKD